MVRSQKNKSRIRWQLLTAGIVGTVLFINRVSKSTSPAVLSQLYVESILFSPFSLSPQYPDHCLFSSDLPTLLLPTLIIAYQMIILINNYLIVLLFSTGSLRGVVLGGLNLTQFESSSLRKIMQNLGTEPWKCASDRFWNFSFISFTINPPLPTSVAPIFFYLSPSISAQKALPIPLCLDNSFSTQLPILPETPVGLGTFIESPKPQASPQSSLSGRRCSFSTFKSSLPGRGLLLKCVSGRGPSREGAGARSLFGPEAWASFPEPARLVWQFRPELTRKHTQTGPARFLGCAAASGLRDGKERRQDLARSSDGSLLPPAFGKLSSAFPLFLHPPLKIF